MFRVTTTHEIDGEVERGAYADKAEADAVAEHYRVCGGFLQITVTDGDSATVLGPREGDVKVIEAPDAKAKKN